MKNPCEQFKHTLTVEITTQFPQTSNSFTELIRQMLGPWCKSVNVVRMNDEGVEYTSRQLNPLSDEYVGHIIADEYMKHLLFAGDRLKALR
jgi:hypothetical protein